MDNETSFANRRTLIIVLAVVLVLVVGGWALFGRSGGSSASTPPKGSAPKLSGPAAVGSTSSTATPAPAYESACGLRGGVPGPLVSTPPAVRWVNAEGWVLPISDTQGPARRSASGPWSCFGHTPTGAALAAYVIPIRLGTAPDYRAVIAQQTVPGVGQQALLAAGQPDRANASPITAKGVTVNSYTGQDATVSLYVAGNGAPDLTCSVNLQWFGGSKGDWRIRLESNGDSYSTCVQNAPTSFVPWGPAQ